jgi:hypothetical protein
MRIRAGRVAPVNVAPGVWTGETRRARAIGARCLACGVCRFADLARSRASVRQPDLPVRLHTRGTGLEFTCLTQRHAPIAQPCSPRTPRAAIIAPRCGAWRASVPAASRTRRVRSGGQGVGSTWGISRSGPGAADERISVRPARSRGESWRVPGALRRFPAATACRSSALPQVSADRTEDARRALRVLVARASVDRPSARKVLDV